MPEKQYSYKKKNVSHQTKSNEISIELNRSILLYFVRKSNFELACVASVPWKLGREQNKTETLATQANFELD